MEANQRNTGIRGGSTIGVSEYGSVSARQSKPMEMIADRAISLGMELEPLVNRLGAFRHRLGAGDLSCPGAAQGTNQTAPPPPTEFIPRMNYALGELDRQITQLADRLNDLEAEL